MKTQTWERTHGATVKGCTTVWEKNLEYFREKLADFDILSSIYISGYYIYEHHSWI